MADYVDQAQSEEELLIRRAIANKKPEGPVARGYCLECGDESVGSARWCSVKCARDWDRRAMREQRR